MKKKQKPPKVIRQNGIPYTEGSKCPACSSEIDTGGRLTFHKRTNWFLKCEKCKYSIKTFKSILKQEARAKKRRDRAVGIK